MTASNPPDDIHPDSGFRLPLPKREDLTDEAKKVFDQLSDPKGGSLVGLKGPGGIRLHSPELSVRMQGLNRYLRMEAGFSGPVRELAILVAAREMDSRFEWAAHEPAGLKEGLSQEVIDIVKHNGSVDGLPEMDSVIIQFGRQLFRERRVAPDLFARALALFGARGLVDLVSLMGLYSATASLLAAFDIQLHPGTEALLPVP